MPEVDPQARQQLKQEAARMAITDANLSQYMAAAGGTVALADPLRGAILAVGAAMLGVCGNYRQAVANDPPRDDYADVWVAQAGLDDNLVPAEEPLGTLHRFAGYLALVADANYALLRSLERYDGALGAGDAGAAATQADAARQNGERLAALQGTLKELTPGVNDAWSSLRAEAGRDFASVTLGEVQKLYRDAWGEPPNTLGAPLQEVVNSLYGTASDLLEPFDPVAAHPILSATEVPTEPEALVGDEYTADLAADAGTLRALVTEGSAMFDFDGGVRIDAVNSPVPSAGEPLKAGFRVCNVGAAAGTAVVTLEVDGVDSGVTWESSELFPGECATPDGDGYVHGIEGQSEGTHDFEALVDPAGPAGGRSGVNSVEIGPAE